MCAENSPAPRQDTAIFRILDAAGNRAREALRVIEDYLRFALDDRHLTALCKNLRHDLTEALGAASPEERLASRDTQADVGTQLSTAAEQSRATCADVLEANFARLQEALRSLEEFGKVFASGCAAPQPTGLAAECKRLRYRSYTLHRAAVTTVQSIERLSAARLYVLVDGRASAGDFEGLVRSLIGAGVGVIQLRDKSLGDRALLDRARRLRTLIRGAATLFVMNDRPDLAVLARADGVHIGQDELSVKEARAIVGPAALIGVSTHSLEQARQAVLDGANYIGVGPIFPSVTKEFTEFPGIELLRQVSAEIRLPSFAIGGIDRENVEAVLAAGASRIAVSGAITAAADPAEAARALLDQLTLQS